MFSLSRYLRTLHNISVSRLNEPIGLTKFTYVSKATISSNSSWYYLSTCNIHFCPLQSGNSVSEFWSDRKLLQYNFQTQFIYEMGFNGSFRYINWYFTPLRFVRKWLHVSKKKKKYIRWYSWVRERMNVTNKRDKRRTTNFLSTFASAKLKILTYK